MKPGWTLPVYLFLAALALLPGCGGDNDGRCVEPVIGLSVWPDSAEVELGRTVTVTAAVCAVCESSVIWYVNHVKGGNSEYGTVTQTNPAVYAAPDRMPQPERVTIMAVSAHDARKADGCVVNITFTVVHVDAVEGDDQTGTGAVTRPLKTITRGLRAAEPGMAVRVANGIYDSENGEEFPLVLGQGIRLVGEDWEETRIQGSVPEAVEPKTAVLLEGSDCLLGLFEVTGDSATTEIRIADTADRAHITWVRLPAIHDVGLAVGSAKDVRIDNCFGVNPARCYCGTGFRFEGGDVGTLVRACTLTSLDRAVEFADPSDALVALCDLSGNAYGFYLDDTTGGLPPSPPRPDAGGGARGSIGQNILLCDCGLANATPDTIFARANTWNHYPPVEGEDFCNLVGGAVIW